jgi:Fe-S cluster assembly protein SufD
MKLINLNALDSKGVLKELNASKNKLVAADNFVKIKLPSKKSEEYRYFKIEPLLEKDWNILNIEQNEIKKDKKIVIEDGAIKSTVDGVEVEIKEFSDIEATHFDSIYYLSHLLAKKAIVLRVTKDMAFEIEHIVNSDALINYRVVILIDSNTHAKIYESYKFNSSAFVINGFDIFLAKDASLNLIKNSTYKSGAVIISSSNFKIDRNSEFNYLTYDFAKDNFLNLFNAILEENANFRANHLQYLKNSANGGNVSKIIHKGINSKSNQVAKTILQDKSVAIFDALIKVLNSAKYTSAHQNSKAVLLDEKSYMASKPQLEIYIDDLEASHGSTTGQLDKDAMFYLQSRGINKQDAKKMLILAFANELIEEIKDDNLKDRVQNSFEIAYYDKIEIDCIKTCHECEENILG